MNSFQEHQGAAEVVAAPVGSIVTNRDVHSDYLRLSNDFVAAALSQEQVGTCPHNIYKYPARFAPEFAREAIREFTAIDDVIVDCFSGGGTSLIEAVALKRRAIGFDISSLACFLARAKTTPLSIHDQRTLESWVRRIEQTGVLARIKIWSESDTETGYYRRNLPVHVVKVFAGILAKIKGLSSAKQQNFCRLALLSVGQTLLDCRTVIPSSEQILQEYCSKFRMHLDAHRDYTWCLSRRMGIEHGSLRSRRRIINGSSEFAGLDGRVPTEWGKAKLLITSPPYPGVHMLYHRWQLLGRRETPAPFLLADCRDGDGESYYTLGGRKAPGLEIYFSKIRAIFGGIKAHLRSDALVIQMVAFNEPATQLPEYLSAMEDAGYSEVRIAADSIQVIDGRLWRPVPGRKWYVATRGSGSAGKEVVLFHRLQSA